MEFLEKISRLQAFHSAQPDGNGKTVAVMVIFRSIFSRNKTAGNNLEFNSK